MKKINHIVKTLFVAVFLVPSSLMAQENNTSNVFNQGLRYCEGSIPYKNMVLVSNFGTKDLNPLNLEGKGYIASIEGNRVETIIPATGYLNAPKGLAVLDDHLFVADVGRVAVFDLNKPTAKPRYIQLAKDDLFANDVVVYGGQVFVSVTNTGRIYSIDATNIKDISEKPILKCQLDGVNGMAIHENKLYAASYDPHEKPTKVNVIYVCDLASEDKIFFTPLIKDLPGGQYDGVAVSADGKNIYFSSWTGELGAAIYRYSLFGTEPVARLDFGVKFYGPADISLQGNMIYIPDLAKSTVYKFTLE